MKRSLAALGLLIVVLAAGAGWYVYSKQPSRQGMVELQHLLPPDVRALLFQGGSAA